MKSKKKESNYMLKRGCILLGIVIMMVNTKGVVAANYKSHEVKINYLHKSSVDNYSIVFQGNTCHLINTDTNIKDNFKGKQVRISCLTMIRISNLI